MRMDSNSSGPQHWGWTRQAPGRDTCTAWGEKVSRAVAVRWEEGVGFRTVLRQSNCKEHSKRVHELQERADLFSSELQHTLSPLNNITSYYTVPSHPLGARKVIRARMWFLAVLIFPAPHSRVNKGHRETLPSHHKTAETAARASRWHTQECAGAPAPAAAASGSRGLASGSDHPSW